MNNVCMKICRSTNYYNWEPQTHYRTNFRATGLKCNFARINFRAVRSIILCVIIFHKAILHDMFSLYFI